MRHDFRRHIPAHGGLAARAAIGAAVVLAAASLAAAGVEESWSVYRVAGVPMGYVHERAETDAAGGAVTTADSRVVMNRLGSRIEIAIDVRTEEDASGSLLRSVTRMALSRQVTTIEARVEGGSLVVLTSSGGEGAAPHARSLPLEGPLAGPEAIRRLGAARLHGPGDEIAYTTFVPEVGAVLTLRRRAAAVEEVPLEEGPARLLKVEETAEGQPVRRTLWLDAEGRAAFQQEPGPFGLVEVVRAPRASALRAAEGAELPKEMYERSMVRSNVRLPSPRLIESVTLRLRLRDPAMGWPDLEAENQRVVSKTADTVVLRVTRPEEPGGGGAGAGAVADGGAAPTEIREHLAPNAYIESEHPDIAGLAREVAPAGLDRWEAALRLAAWVEANMSFDPGIVMAPASELIRDRRATCAGYATLLASLARAAGVPARYVMGYVYYLGIWGGHAWVEVSVGGRWIPLDAAVYAPGAADAARFSFYRGSLVEGLSGSVLAGSRLFGNLEVGVEEYVLDGGTVRVDPGAPPHVVRDDTYTNPGLGLRLRRPAGAVFAETDRVYPDPTLVAIQGPGGAVVRLQERKLFPHHDAASAAAALLDALKIGGRRSGARAAGRPAWEETSATKAALAVADGSTVYALVAEGPGARRLLGKAARGLRIGGPTAAAAALR
jgi:transglutaminase-like putative cysteine protease